MSTTDRAIGKHLAGEAETRWRSLPEVTPEMETKARRVVAGAAENAADCRMLLEALGLLPAVIVEEAA